MTAKEKALRICQKMGCTTMFAEDCNEGRTLPKRIAKMCAVIAVNEILEGQNLLGLPLSYWQDVKKEIELL